MGLDEHGVIVTANTRAAAMTGRSIDDLVGRSFLDLIGEDDRSTITARWGLAASYRIGDDPADGRAGDSGSGDRGSAHLPVFALVDAAGTPHLAEATLHRSSLADGAHVVILRDLSRSATKFGRARTSPPAVPAGVPFGAHRDGARPARRQQDRRRQPVARRHAATPPRIARRDRDPRDHTSRRSAGRSHAARPARTRDRRHVPARSAVPPQRRRVRVGPAQGVGRRGRWRGVGDHAHRGRHRPTTHRRTPDPRRDA